MYFKQLFCNQGLGIPLVTSLGYCFYEVVVVKVNSLVYSVGCLVLLQILHSVLRISKSRTVRFLFVSNSYSLDLAI